MSVSLTSSPHSSSFHHNLPSYTHSIPVRDSHRSHPNSQSTSFRPPHRSPEAYYAQMAGSSSRDREVNGYPSHARGQNHGAPHAHHPQREGLHRFFSSPNIHHSQTQEDHERERDREKQRDREAMYREREREEEYGRRGSLRNVKLERDDEAQYDRERRRDSGPATGLGLATSPAGPGQMGSYSAMARLTIGSNGNGAADRYAEERSRHLGSIESDFAREERERDREWDREKVREREMDRAEAGIEIRARGGDLVLPPMKSAFSPPSPTSSSHTYRGGNVPAAINTAAASASSSASTSAAGQPHRTGRPHSQSVSSSASPYTYSASSSASSFLLPSPSALGNLRPSFAYSPPKQPLAGLPIHASRNADHPPMHRHMASSSLPGNGNEEPFSPPAGASFLRPQSFSAATPLTQSLSASGSASGDFTPGIIPSGPSANAKRKSRSRSGSNAAPSSLMMSVKNSPIGRNGIEKIFSATINRKKKGGNDQIDVIGNGNGDVAMDGGEDGDDGFQDMSRTTSAGERGSGSGVGTPTASGAQNGSPTDPSAVRRLAHLQCEQRRRESINGGFATLRNILPETTAADSKAAILQKAINYIQNLEQAVRASGGKVDGGVASALSPLGQMNGSRPPRRKRTSTLVSHSEPASPPFGSKEGQFLSMSTAASSMTDLGQEGSDVARMEDDDVTMEMDRNRMGDAAEDMAMAMSDDEDRDIERVGPPKKTGLSPLDLLVGVAEQARNLSRRGNDKGHTHTRSFERKSDGDIKIPAGASWHHIELGPRK